MFCLLIKCTLMDLIQFIVVKITCIWNLLKKNRINSNYFILHLFAFLFGEKQEKYFKKYFKSDFLICK